MRDELDKYQQSFQNMEGKIHVLEHQIPLEEQMDYFRESKDWKELTKKRSSLMSQNARSGLTRSVWEKAIWNSRKPILSVWPIPANLKPSPI